MLGVSVIAAPTDAEARLLFSSQQQSFVRLRVVGEDPVDKFILAQHKA